MKVLIVDDKPENLYLLEAIFKGNGYTPVLATNGKEALDRANKEIPDLIVSDILMPVMDGFTLCREFKKDINLSSVPFIFYTATYTDYKDEEFAMSLGADKYMVKPMDPDEFMENIADVLSNIKVNHINPADVPSVPESVIMKEYNEALIRKLEDKMAQTEAAEKELREKQAELEMEIEERKKNALELMEAKEKAETSDKLKTEFLAQMSHEIRTPLNIALCFTGLIKEELQEIMTPTLTEYFEAIKAADKRLIRTIDLILNMSEVQIGTYEPILKNIDLMTNVFSNIQAEYTMLAKWKGLEFNFINRVQRPNIYADQYSIYQIFVNLVDNAIKYTSEGKVDIVIDKDEEDNIEVVVHDTGIGIAKEHLGKIFEPFTQEDHGYTRRFDGNGLGLALVKKYCEINGASISVKSEKGRGSSFIVTFQAKKEILCN